MKKFLQISAKFLARVCVFPVFVFMVVEELFFKDGHPFQGCSQLLSLVPGLHGIYFRQQFYCMAIAECHDDCCIEFGTRFSQRGIEIGHRVYIGSNCSIGLCKIEDDVMLGSNVDIISGKKQHYFDCLETPMREQGGELQQITISEDSWLGNSSVIMANVGKKSIVAAGSVVTQDVPPYSIVGGNPAKVLRSRL